MGTMSKAVLRYRHSSAITVAAIVVMISMLSLATWAPYLLVLLLIPLVVAIWAWRTGTDADESGLTVTAVVGRRRIPWADVAGLVPTDRGGVSAQLTTGMAIRLPAVPAADAARLVAASGTELVTDPR
jgi:hypothetical protein